MNAPVAQKISQETVNENVRSNIRLKTRTEKIPKKKKEKEIKINTEFKEALFFFPESLADRNQHAAGRAGLRHV